MGKHVAANGITLLIVALVVGMSVMKWVTGQMTEEGPLAEETFITIPGGATAGRITDILVEKGAISSAFLFKWSLNRQDKAEAMKAGFYQVPAGASINELIELLTTGSGGSTRYQATYRLRNDGFSARLVDRVETGSFADLEPDAIQEKVNELLADGDSLELRVAVPEGLTSWQIVEGLKAVPFLDGEIADLPAEGALAPNTFSISPGMPRQSIIDQMLAAQKKIVADAWEERDPSVPLQSPAELLILASIVEKETGVAEERGLVAGVFTNRLREGMRLQTDPTVIYGITNGQGVLGRGIRRSELERRTPYNTYVIKGLPPTPIANPGREAIKAAANPSETDYVFFVADGTGGHAFAATLREHEENVKRWREIEQERAGE
ncbi:endolytic transglycosylase MltG [Halovulum sp. GXIMD14793]